MKRIILLVFVLSFSILQAQDNTATQLDAARERALKEEQKLADKEAKAQAKAEKKAAAEEQKRLKAEEKARLAEEKTTKHTESTDKPAEKKGYSFWGRNAIGFNFAPTIQVALTTLPFKISSIQHQLGGIQLDDKNGGFGMGFSYEHKLARFITLSGDFNFANFGLNLSYKDVDKLLAGTFPANDIDKLRSKAKVDLNFKTMAWAAGVRIYTKGNAPFGFFLYPRIGGTIVDFSGSYPQYKGGNFENIDNVNDIETKNFRTKTHGIYAAMELGWRILLFPKTGANWKVQVALDISLLDIGYYFNPWSSGMLSEIKGAFGADFASYQKYANIRFVPLPRLGVTIKF